MKSFFILKEFFEMIEDDPGIGPAHISLYAAILNGWINNNCVNPVKVSRDELMSTSKISARRTFYKMIKELEEAGFIKYEASINQFIQSEIYLMEPDVKLSQYRN